MFQSFLKLHNFCLDYSSHFEGYKLTCVGVCECCHKLQHFNIYCIIVLTIHLLFLIL
uniref:Uncharacterized protein n=1 Tax=Dicentrarchus labrax TaxID=13489 RepID=A0A8C4HSV3_DICLA